MGDHKHAWIHNNFIYSVRPNLKLQLKMDTMVLISLHGDGKLGIKRFTWSSAGLDVYTILHNSVNIARYYDVCYLNLHMCLLSK